MPLSGGCQCGAVRYAVAAEPVAVYVCHCRECQKQSASAFGISVELPMGVLRLEQGEIGTWTRAADSGRLLECMFCTRCGSRLWHASAGLGTISVKGGSLDRPPDLSSAIHIWTSRKLAGVIIPEGCRQFPEEPG